MMSSVKWALRQIHGREKASYPSQNTPPVSNIEVFMLEHFFYAGILSLCQYHDISTMGERRAKA